MYIDVTIQLCTCVFTTALIIAFRSRKEFQKRQTKVFFGMLVVLALNSLCSGISNLIENSIAATGTLFAIQYTTQLLLFLIHNALCPLYAYYVMLVNGYAVHTSRKKLFVYAIPFIALELLTLSNPWSKILFTYDQNSDYVRGSLFFIIYLVSVFYLSIAIFYMIKYRKLVSSETNFMLWLFFSFSIIGVVVQGIFPEFKIEIMAECLSALGIMLSIEDERDLIDPATKMYNRRAFMNDNRRLIETNHEYGVITISITNIRLFVRLLSYKSMADTIARIAKYLTSLSKHAHIYRISTGNIAIVHLYDNPEETIALAETIKSRFDEGWEYEGAPLDFNVIIGVAMIPEDTNKTSALLDMAEGALGTDVAGVHIMSREDAKAFIKRGSIEAAIRKALSGEGFEVYYQPIWGVKENKYVAAEALLRLKSPELGNIPPSIFIPIAEKSGLIGEVGLFVFRSVCEFLCREDVKALNLRCIDVNLSLYQLIVGNVPEQFAKIMKDKSISPSMINLEITETAQLDGLGTIANGVDELKAVGFKFSLDDFGTGYANLSNLVAMKFDTIKSDKALLWDSAKDDMSKHVLRSYIKIISGMGIDLIQEGVETKEQLDLVTSCGANYIQGYYFSKPLPADEFIQLFA